MFEIMSISSKGLIFLRNSQRLKALFLANNICNTSQVINYFNLKSFADGNKCRELLLNGNKCLFKPLFALNMSSTAQPFDASTYERIADQTLEYLYEEFDKLMETNGEFKDSDISLNNGVITLNLGLHGIYVINKQTPNQQIWFSSPLSGPKRYDYVNKEWIYKRDSTSLFSLLSSELSHILKREIKFKPLNL